MSDKNQDEEKELFEAIEKLGQTNMKSMLPSTILILGLRGTHDQKKNAKNK